MQENLIGSEIFNQIICCCKNPSKSSTEDRNENYEVRSDFSFPLLSSVFKKTTKTSLKILCNLFVSYILMAFFANVKARNISR